MAFMKDRTIYESEKSRVYINQCHAKGKKTNAYAIRKDDKTGMMHYIGGIVWDGAWRQYVFEPEKVCDTKWSAGCLEEIAAFLRLINKKARAKWKGK